MDSFPPTTQKATFASGCFWGVEHIFRQNYGANASGSSKGKGGLLDARVGYTGGASGSAPTYRTVCSGTTGHAEAVLILFDPDRVSYRSLVEFFFRTHDPTTRNRQGHDSGTQYRSAIYADNEEQLAVAKEVKAQVQERWDYGGGVGKKSVVTEVEMAGPWFDAEDYHQLYLENNPGGYQCSSHHVRTGAGFPSLEKAGAEEAKAEL
jgi:peptide-methionine (S)-S-oxide reductase